MSKSKTLVLVNLIQSMTQAEKRHFKIFAKRHVIGSQNAYLEIYEALNGQKNLTDQDLKAQLRNSMSTQQFHVLKNHLYQMLLKSLRSFHEEKDVESRLRKMLSEINVLYSKNLYEQCHIILEKANKLAVTYEKVLYQIEVNKWYHTLLRKQRDTQLLQNYTNDHYKNQKALLEKLENEEALVTLESRIFSLKEKHPYIRNENEEQLFNEVMSDPLLQAPQKAQGFEGKLSYYNTHNIYLRVRGALKESYESRKQLIELWEHHPHQKAENPLKYLVAVGNLLGVQKELGKYEEGLQLLKKLNPLKGLSFQIDKEIFLLEQQFQLITYVATGQYKRGLALKLSIEQGLQRFDGHIRDDWLFDYYFDQGMLHAMAGKPNKALDWIRLIEQTFRKDQFPQKMSYAKLFNLMIHTDLGNQVYLESALRSTYRYLKNRATLYEFEQLVLQFIQKLPFTSDRIQYQKHLRALLGQLEELSQKTNERRAMDYLNFRAWVYSKLYNKSFADAVAEQVH